MNISVTGKQLDIGDALRKHVEGRLSTVVEKYFSHSIEAKVIFSRQGASVRTDCSVHPAGGISLQSHGEAADAYASFDLASERLEKRLRRTKRQLKSHHD